MANSTVGDKIKEIFAIDLSENIRSAMVAETTGTESTAEPVAERIVSSTAVGTLEVEEEGLLLQSLNQVDQSSDAQAQPDIQESTLDRLKTRVSYYIPILGWLPQYNYKSYLVSDAVAGLGVAAMLIPQALAYAILARLPPSMGLYTAFFPVILYFFLGTSRQLSIGPDALSSLLVGIIMAERELDNPHEAVPALAMMVGIVLFSLGIIRVGFLDNVLSRPLLCGFVNAVAVTIIMEQSDVFFGIQLAGEAKNLHGWRKVAAALDARSTANGVTIIIGLCTVGLLLLNRYLKKRFTANKYVPEPLVAVVLGICLNAAVDFTQYGVSILGKMTSGFEAPRLPSLQYLERSNGFCASHLLGLCSAALTPIFPQIFILLSWLASLALLSILLLPSFTPRSTTIKSLRIASSSLWESLTFSPPFLAHILLLAPCRDQESLTAWVRSRRSSPLSLQPSLG